MQAGLFSAVATAFIIESYKQLQPDYDRYIAGALYVALSAARNGSSIIEIGPSTLDFGEPSDVTITSSSRWVNGLWFMSLAVALAVALLCILVKQWLEEYKSRTSGSFETTRLWARRREFYFTGVREWHVPGLISTLPLLLHVALFLFFAGLSLPLAFGQRGRRNSAGSNRLLVLVLRGVTHSSYLVPGLSLRNTIRFEPSTFSSYYAPPSSHSGPSPSIWTSDG